MNPDPKPRKYEDPKFLAFIRAKPCEVCCRDSVAAHVRKQYWGAGTGKKPWDYVAISLCDNPFGVSHHKELDKVGMERFEERCGIDIKRIIIRNLIEFFTEGIK